MIRSLKISLAFILDLLFRIVSHQRRIFYLLLLLTTAFALQLLLVLLHRADKVAPPADLVAVFPEDERDRDQRHLQQPQQRAGPVGAEPVVHVGADQGHDAAQDAADHRVAGQR